MKWKNIFWEISHTPLLLIDLPKQGKNLSSIFKCKKNFFFCKTPSSIFKRLFKKTFFKPTKIQRFKGKEKYFSIRGIFFKMKKCFQKMLWSCLNRDYKLPQRWSWVFSIRMTPLFVCVCVLYHPFFLPKNQRQRVTVRQCGPSFHIWTRWRPPNDNSDGVWFQEHILRYSFWMLKSDRFLLFKEDKGGDTAKHQGCSSLSLWQVMLSEETLLGGGAMQKESIRSCCGCCCCCHTFWRSP